MKPGMFPGLLLSVFFVFCDGQGTQDLAKNPIPDLTGTVWEHRRLDIENGIDFYVFDKVVDDYSWETYKYKYRDRKGWYTEYNCELGHYQGTYVVNDDILYLREIGTVSDLPGSAPEIKVYSHLVLTDKGLKVIHATYKNSSGWFRYDWGDSVADTVNTWYYVKRADNQVHNAE